MNVPLTRLLVHTLEEERGAAATSGSPGALRRPPSLCSGKKNPSASFWDSGHKSEKIPTLNRSSTTSSGEMQQHTHAHTQRHTCSHNLQRRAKFTLKLKTRCHTNREYEPMFPKLAPGVQNRNKPPSHFNSCFSTSAAKTHHAEFT